MSNCGAFEGCYVTRRLKKEVALCRNANVYFSARTKSLSINIKLRQLWKGFTSLYNDKITCKVVKTDVYLVIAL